MDSRNSPDLILGLANYLTELKLDENSILNSYYNKNCNSFSLEEDEEVD